MQESGETMQISGCLGLPLGRGNQFESLSVPGVTCCSYLALASSQNMIFKICTKSE